MTIKHLIDEDFVNYKYPSMFICFPTCTWKCEKKSGAVCQNRQIASLPDVTVDPQIIVERYIRNDITKAIVFGGLEPLDQLHDVVDLILQIRNVCIDDIVIYTGYNEDEIEVIIKQIQDIGKHNVIIKFGRFIPNRPSRFDHVLGVELASDNQYAKKICE